MHYSSKVSFFLSMIAAFCDLSPSHYYVQEISKVTEDNLHMILSTKNAICVLLSVVTTEKRLPVLQ